MSNWKTLAFPVAVDLAGQNDNEVGTLFSCLRCAKDWRVDRKKKKKSV